MQHLIVTNDYPPKIGGIQSLLWEWWRRLPPDRFAVLTSPYKGAEEFDARFFGFYPREAEILDPQHRVFLECAWEALERAGYDPEAYDGLIGVYGGAGMNTYLLRNLLQNRDILGSVHG